MVQGQHLLQTSNGNNNNGVQVTPIMVRPGSNHRVLVPVKHQ